MLAHHMRLVVVASGRRERVLDLVRGEYPKPVFCTERPEVRQSYHHPNSLVRQG